MTIEAGHGQIDGRHTRWLEADGAAPILYVHGVPDDASLWTPLLERCGGVAVDLPGFGESAKPADFPYSIDGYADWLESFVAQRGLEDFSLVVHDWGAVALALAQRAPQRIRRLVLLDAVPLLEGYEWHRLARAWRRPLVGELTMGFTLKTLLRRELRKDATGDAADAHVDSIWRHFDHGTQRAILKLYRSAPASALAQAGLGLGALTCPALVAWGQADSYIPADFARSYAEALGGPTKVTVRESAGHWPWLDDASLLDEIVDFLRER